MGIETLRCPACASEIAVGVPRGGSVLDVTDRAPTDDHGTFEGEARGSDADNGEHGSDSATKHRSITCSNGHDFGFRFTV